MLGLSLYQGRGGIHNTNTEFILVVAAIKKFITEAIKHLSPNNIVRLLYGNLNVQSVL